MDDEERERREIQIDLVEIQARLRIVTTFTAISFSAFITLFTAGYISGVPRITNMSILYGVAAIMPAYWLYNSLWKKFVTIREKYIHD